MTAVISKLHEANLYIDAKEYAGVATEVTLPEVKPVMMEHAPTSLKGKLDLPIGLEKMTMTIKGDFHEAFAAMSVDFFHMRIFEVRSTLTEFDELGRSVEKSVVATVRGLFQGSKAGPIKNGAAVEMEYTIGVFGYSLQVEDVPIHHINMLDNTLSVVSINLHEKNNTLLGM
jgi:P2 family phage contractile tail tube protein